MPTRSRFEKHSHLFQTRQKRGLGARGVEPGLLQQAADLAHLTVATLVVSAGEDLLTPDGAGIAAAIPGARHLAIPGAGHAVGLEAPDAVNEAVLAHLARS